jgi:hypothetical protein
MEKLPTAKKDSFKSGSGHRQSLMIYRTQNADAPLDLMELCIPWRLSRADGTGNRLACTNARQRQPSSRSHDNLFLLRARRTGGLAPLPALRRDADCFVSDPSKAGAEINLRPLLIHSNDIRSSHALHNKRLLSGKLSNQPRQLPEETR